MSVKQISVFLENKAGALSDMTRILADNNIDMRAFSLSEASDFGIARVIVDDIYKATTVLKDAGYVHSVSEVLAVAIPDVPGGLNKILTVLSELDINLEYMYAFLGAKKNAAYMIMKTSDPAKISAVLTGKGIRLAEQEELSEM